jgi:hypothetical protein
VTGPEHYQEAEHALLDAETNGDFGSDVETYNLRRAQVHATLALAAATALRSSRRVGSTGYEWDAACASSQTAGGGS